MLQVFRKRFCEGLDLGEDRVIADAACEVGLNPDAILAAAYSQKLRAKGAAGWRRAAERDRIFGVPTFA